MRDWAQWSDEMVRWHVRQIHFLVGMLFLCAVGAAVISFYIAAR
jgi:hypothetical protein